MKTTNTNTARFTINFFEKTISGTKASFTKASKGISPIYEELTMKMNAHPTFELVEKEQKHTITRAKRTYEGMDYKFMEDYITTKKNAALIMAEYKSVKKYAKNSGISAYPFVKKWFLGEFDPDHEGFDMEQAKKEISDYKIAEAILNTQRSLPADADNAA